MSEFKLEEVYALIKHGERLLAGLYQASKTLHSLNLSKECKELISALKDERMTMENPKFPHLPEDKIKKFGEGLRQQFAVLMHVQMYQGPAVRVLNAAAKVSRSFDLSWNYIFVRPVMKLFTCYVKVMLFVKSLEDVEKVPVVYNYCYLRTTKVPLEETEGLVKFVSSRDMRKLEEETRQVTDQMYGMFKVTVNVLQRVLGAGPSFDWSLLNMCDNPEATLPSGTFFKMEYIVMMQLGDVVNWFLAFFAAKISTFSSDPQFADLIQLVGGQNKKFELFADFTVELKHIVDDWKKCKKDVKVDVQDRPMNRQFRRKRLAMAIQEILTTIDGDVDVLCMKWPIVLSALGFAHWEVSSTMTSKYKYTPDMLSLVSALTSLVTVCLKKSEIIKRFIVFNLREYDAAFIDSLIHSSQIPQVAYEQLQVVVNALRTLDIEDYDKGKRYDLFPMHLAAGKIMTYFNEYGTTHGVLHLAPLFNMLSTFDFHVRTFVSPANVVLESAPLQTYWRFLNDFKELAREKTAVDGAEAPCLVALCHFYGADSDALAEFPACKKMIQQSCEFLLGSVSDLLIVWAKDYMKELSRLDDQESADMWLKRSEARQGAGKKEGKKGAAKQLSLEEIVPGDEGCVKYRNTLNELNESKQKIARAMQLLREIGTIKVLGKEYNPLDYVVGRMKDLIGTMFNVLQPTPPAKLTKLVNNAKQVLSTLLMAASLNPLEMVSESIAKLKVADVTVNDKSAKLGENTGIIPAMYRDFYRKFFKEDIQNTFYSSTRQAFMPVGNLSFRTHEWASRSALRSLYELIGLKGVAVIDIMATDIVNELFGTLADLIERLIPTGSDHMPNYIQNPTLVLNADKIVAVLCHIGAILKFRSLLKDAGAGIATVSDDDSEFKYSNHAVPPHEDAVLASRLDSNKVVNLFRNPNFALLFGTIFAEPFWDSLKYYANEDAFTNNCHLICHAIDALVGIVMRKTQSFDVITKYKELLIAAGQGIRIGSEFANQSKKKIKYPHQIMYLVLDHFVKGSVYADYAILEPIVSYHLIRSIYAATLKAQTKQDVRKETL